MPYRISSLRASDAFKRDSAGWTVTKRHNGIGSHCNACCGDGASLAKSYDHCTSLYPLRNHVTQWLVQRHIERVDDNVSPLTSFPVHKVSQLESLENALLPVHPLKPSLTSPSLKEIFRSVFHLTLLTKSPPLSLFPEKEITTVHPRLSSPFPPSLKEIAPRTPLHLSSPHLQ